jgi:hypothetical protein
MSVPANLLAQKWIVTGFGDLHSLKLVESKVHAPGADEVIVEVRAAGVNPSDYKRIAGAYGMNRADLPMPIGPTNTRPVHVSARPILVGLLLLADERSPLTINALADLFEHRLSTASQDLLGLSALASPPSASGSSQDRRYRATRNAFHRMLALMDPYPHNSNRTLTITEVKAVLDAHDAEREAKMKTRLDEFTTAFLQMAFRLQPEPLRQGSIDLAIDQTFIPAPNPRGYWRRSLSQRIADVAGSDSPPVRGPVDVFAGW